MVRRLSSGQRIRFRNSISAKNDQLRSGLSALVVISVNRASRPEIHVLSVSVVPKRKLWLNAGFCKGGMESL
jgi:hypothetical protein